ncbi:facilitated trehalose transporter Tret1 [Nilaparvata lugens]|uniref:facilitated trehalose transporter Tret1 n=1 Tax=Nilaparvata lugens TaxID=108931 RepID=UPI00193DC19A|nr:facilitated trehalose transporter Tret1 [Nilaparvata lugens]XP_039278093.1 facilitated trehalose transporter Tret1 [Nilaparvata lugens]XP_039278094.1 facilitated trehalose transporter Tret1 [Nilaparvata lugens]
MKGEASLPGIYVIKSLVTTNGVSDEKIEPEKPKEKSHRQWMCAIIATLSLFTMGMIVGWTSPVIPKFGEDPEAPSLDEHQVSWVVSLVYFGGLFSPLATGLLMDRCGRKAGLILTSAEAILSWVVLLFTKSPTGVYVGRFLGGTVGGSAFTVVPIYICEIATPKVRGALNSITLIMAWCGVLFEYAVGPYVSYFTLNLLSGIVPLLVLLLTFIMPESPYYYTMVNQPTKAAQSLAWLRCTTTHHIHTELLTIQETVSDAMIHKKGMTDLLGTSGNRKAFLMTSVLVIVTRLSGISVIIAYAAQAVPDSGFITTDQCAMLICGTWIVVGLLATSLISRFERKPLMVVSCLGCSLATFIYGLYHFLQTNTNLNLAPYTWVPLTSLILHSAFFSVGLGCVPNMVQGELFASNIKGVASGTTCIVIAITSFLTNKLYYPVAELMGIHVNYWFYTVACIGGALFSHYVLLETRNKTLQEIQIELTGEGKVTPNLEPNPKDSPII